MRETPLKPVGKLSRLRSTVEAAKVQLEELRPLRAEALTRLDHYYDIELTYTSNAIEGNTLNAVETTLVIEKGVTISGKPLKDHLEAVDHYAAMLFVRNLARESRPLTEYDIRSIHALVVKRSRPDIAGRYASQQMIPYFQIFRTGLRLILLHAYYKLMGCTVDEAMEHKKVLQRHFNNIEIYQAGRPVRTETGHHPFPLSAAKVPTLM